MQKHKPRKEQKKNEEKRKKNIAQTKTYKRALMTNNEVDTESLPLSPLKYVEHSRSSLHLYVDSVRAHTSSRVHAFENVKFEKKYKKAKEKHGRAAMVAKRENKSENVETGFQTMTKKAKRRKRCQSIVKV